MSRLLRVILVLAFVAIGLLLLRQWPHRADDTTSIDIPSLPARVEAVDPRVRTLLVDARNAVVERPDEAKRWLRLGQTLHANDLAVLARDCYRQAVSLDPSLERGWFHLGQTLGELGESDAAVAAFDEATHLAPGYAPAHWWQGRIDLERGRFEPAEAAFRRALEIDAEALAAWAGLARALLGQDRAAEAARVLEPRVASEGYGFHLLADCYRRLDRPGDAAAAHARARTAAPSSSDPWTDELATLQPGYGARTARARGRLDAGAIEPAVASLEALRRETPENVIVLTNLGQAYRRAGRTTEAVAALEEALERQPGFFQAHFELAVVWAERSRREPSSAVASARARQHARRTTELNPTFAPAHALLGDLDLLAGQLDRSLGQYRTAERLAHDDARWPARSGIVLLRLGRWPEAEESLVRALTMSPNNANALRALAVALLNQRRFEEAESALRRAETLRPDDPGIAHTRRELERLREGAPP